jgi:hypothetical protein
VIFDPVLVDRFVGRAAVVGANNTERLSSIIPE